MATQIHGAGPAGQRSPGLDLAIAGYLTENPPAGGGATALNDLTDVDTTGATTGQVLTFDGSEWSPDAPSAGTVTSTSISDSTATGRAVLTAADAATARAAIGAGTSNLALGTTAGTAAAGNDSRITSAVPNTRTVNGKALSSNITLTASDVSAAPASGQFPVNTVAASGSTETLPATHAAHRVTMDQNCTFTFAAPTAGHAFLLHLSGAFTPTFPGSVTWAGGSAPTYASAGTWYSFVTLDGGTTWRGAEA